MGDLVKRLEFLLVEDDPHDVRFVQSGFRDMGMSDCLNIVGDGQEAVDYLLGIGKFEERTQYPIPNVMLVDLKMPRKDGFEFLHWLRQLGPDAIAILPAIIMSSSSDPADIIRAYRLGANGYMVKPIDWEAFKRRIKAVSALWVDHFEAPHPSMAVSA